MIQGIETASSAAYCHEMAGLDREGRVKILVEEHCEGLEEVRRFVQSWSIVKSLAFSISMDERRGKPLSTS